MKKSAKVLSVLAVTAAVSMALLTGCKNFLSGGDLKEELDDLIADINAETVSILVKAADGQGSTTPDGTTSFRVGRENKSISYIETPLYQFIRWQVETRDKSGKTLEVLVKDTDYRIEDEANPITKITILKYYEGMTVTPVCIERPAVKGDPSPVLTKDGVARDRAITVRFTKVPSPDSFVFTREEIPEGAEYEETEEGKIHSYTVEDSEGNCNRYFKNITITDSNGESLTDYFNPPELEADDPSLLTVTVARQIPIDVTGFRVVEVTLSQDISGTDGIKMSSDYFWNYKITESTDDKATVTVTSQKTEEGAFMGSAKPEVMGKDYSIGASIQLGFTENAGWQFIKWESSNPEAVRIEEPENASAKAVIWEKTPVGETATVTAMCAPRLSATGSPRSDGTNGTVSRNTAVSVTFSRELPYETEEDRAQLNNISITVGGSPVNTSFSKPVLSDSRTIVTFTPDNSNMIDVPEGQTKTVTVTVPSDFYYKLSDGTKVTTGGNGYSFEYRIDSSTVNKAGIRFDMTQGSGTVTPAAAETPYEYSIGQGVQLKFALNEGYIFNGWTVKAGGESVPSSKISLSDSKSLTPVLTVYEALQGVVVTANCSEKFAVTDISPKGTETTPSKKDEPIKITFNKTPSSKCDLSKIKVSMNGNSIDSYFTERTISGNTITLKNTKRLEIEKGTKKTITITVPESFCYTDTNDISLEDDYTFTYTANYETSVHTDVTFRVINGEDGQPFAAGEAGTLTPSAAERYNLDETANISFAVNEGYQFYGWTCDDTIVTITGDGSQVVLRADEEGNADVTAIVYRRPVVSSKSPYSQNENDTVAKNMPIEIEFTHAIETGCENAIELSYSGANINKNLYYSTTINSTRTQIILNPIKLLPFTSNSNVETMTVKLPHDKIFYKDTVRGYSIYMDDSTDNEWSYKVDDSTVDTVQIKVVFPNGTISVNGEEKLTGNTIVCNTEQNYSLDYQLSNGNVFNGWSIGEVSDLYKVLYSERDLADADDAVLSESQFDGIYFFVDSGIDEYTEDDVYTKIVMSQNENSIQAVITSYKTKLVNAKSFTIHASQNTAACVSSYDPHYYPEGINFDKTITVNFSKEMDVSTLDYDSIRVENLFSSNIVYTNKDVSQSYFYDPVFSNNNKTMKLRVKNSFFEEISGKGLVDLKVVLDKEKIKDNDGRYLIGENEWSYRVDESWETDRPVIKDFCLAGPKLDANNNRMELTKDSSSVSTKNHIRDKVYINCIGFDEGSGVSKLKITETFVQKFNSNTVENIPQNTDPSGYGSFVYSEETPGEYKLENFEYTLKSDYDGKVKLTFQIIDVAGNLSEEIYTYYVFRDTQVSIPKIQDKLFQGDTNGNSSKWEYTGIPSNGKINTKVIRQNSEKDTFNLDFEGAEDTFFRGGTDSITITVYSSYDLNTWEQAIQVPYTDKFKIDRDASKDTYLKIYVTDAVGNTNSAVRIIPAAVSIMNYQEKGITGTFHKCLMFDVSDYEREVLIGDSLSAIRYDYSLVYKYQTDESSALSDYQCIKDGQTNYLHQIVQLGWGFPISPQSESNAKNFRPAGIYYIYLIPYFLFNDGRYSGTISTPLKVTISYPDDVQTVTVDDSGTTDLIMPSLQNMEITLDDPVRNEGIRHAHLELSDYTLDNRYTYFVSYKKDVPDSQWSFSSCFDFTLESCSNYKVAVSAVNSNGERKFSYEKNVDATIDNKPPEIKTQYAFNLDSVNHNSSSYKLFRLKNGQGEDFSRYVNLPFDDSGLKKNSQGLAEIKYYIVPYDTYDSPIITEELLSNYYEYTAVYDEDDVTYIDLPYDNMLSENRNHLFVIKLTDNSEFGNYCYITNKMNSSMIEPKRKLTVSKYSDSGFSINHNISIPEKTFYLTTDSLKESSGKFLWECKSNSIELQTSQTRPEAKFDPIAVNSTFRTLSNNLCADDQKQTFVRINSYYYNEDIAKNECFYPVYFYTDYVLNPDSYPIEKHLMVPGTNGVQIFCDQPTLVHTFYSQSDAGDEDEWLAKGIEIGAVEDNDDFIYQLPDGIPTGWYYVTIAHFVDGSMTMTEPKIKR